MKIYNTLIIDKFNITIHFGIPDNNWELKEMFSLRFNVYSAKNYIDPNKYPEKLEKDSYDTEGKSTYFIAKVESENKIVSSARLIQDIPLPTELYFRFSKPKLIEEIPPNKMVEVGRLITIPFKVNNKQFLPRHIITLLTLKTIFDYAVENEYLGGYAFIKKSLERKLDIINFPIKKIKNFTLNYPNDGPLYNYFHQPQDPVIPVYYLNDEINNYFKKFFDSRLFFNKKENLILMNNIWLYDAKIKVKGLINLLKFTK
ncbi:MAG: hypothetical protein NZ822_02700 [Patescibacteria group bacterium]|nr:hypothetical protein [Patescibacteria group bacterium]